MPNSEVHWHEGMFLRQHHFLTEHRQLVGLMQTDSKWSLHHYWGLRSIRLNEDALGNFRFAVTGLQARLRDGTLIEVPDDGPLPELDLKAALEGNRKVTVYLAVPVLRSGHPNVAGETPKDNARYYLVNREVEDESLGVNSQLVSVRRLHLKLLLSTQNLAGYETVPIARVEKSERAESTPQLDVTYIPPLLACDAWHVLAVGILQEIYDRIGRKIEKLAGQAVSRGLTLESTSPETMLILSQLRELNEAYATLTNLAFVEGIHPLLAYQELCRIVGQLSILSASRRTPSIPRYNHDDLGGCFYQVKRYLDELFLIVPEPDYQERSFIGQGLRMEVVIDRTWLEPGASMFIGVSSPLDADKCVEWLGQLFMKVSSSERVEQIYKMRDKGLEFTHVPERELSSALPKDKGMTFFQINRAQQQNEWQFVEKSRTLAIRFNDSRVVGNIDRQEVITLNLGSHMAFRFKLLVLGAGDTSRKPGARI